MKFNSSFNIQNHKWSSVKHHINRTFENGKHQNYDKNPRINRNLSRFNMSTDGKIKMVNGNPKFVKDNIRDRLYKQQTKTYLAEKTLPWIHEHNQTASVKKNPKRAIPLNQSGAWKKFHNKLNKGQRTLVFQVGNSQQNNDAIKAIEHAKGCGYKQAHNEWAHVTSKALFNTFKSIRSQQEKKHSAVLFQHFTTNVDEATKAQVKNDKLIQRGSDGIHIHVSAIGITSTHLDNNFNRTQAKMAIHKSGKKKGQKYYKVISKPTFNLGRAICADEHIKYSRSFIRIHGRKVNKSVHEAITKMHSKYDPMMLHAVQKQCQKDLSDVPELQQITLIRTGNPHHSEGHGAYVHNKQIQDFMRHFKIKQTRRIKQSLARREHRVEAKEAKIKQQKSNRIRQQQKVQDLKKEYHSYYNDGCYHLHKLEHVIDSKSARSQHLTIQNNKLKKSNQHLSQIHDDFKNYNTQLLQQNKEQRARLDKGTKAIQSMIPKLSTLTKKHDDLQEQNTNLGEANTELHSQSEQLQQRINQQDNTMADIKRKFAIIKKNNKQIIKDIADGINKRTTARFNQLKNSFKNGVAKFNNKIDSIYNNTKSSWQHKLAQIKEAHATIKIPAKDIEKKLQTIQNKDGLTFGQSQAYTFASIRDAQGDGDKPIKVKKSVFKGVDTPDSEADDIEPTVVPKSSKSKFDKHASDDIKPNDKNTSPNQTTSATDVGVRASRISSNIFSNKNDKHKREIRARRERGLTR